ncbi:MAG: DUF3179 domain-containing protein [Solirubrobacterales bacterium]
MDPARRHDRRQFLKGAAALGVVAAASGAGAWRLLAGGDGGTAVEAGEGVSLDRLAANVVSGGPGKDGIPAIDEPRFVAASEASFLTDEEVVFGLLAGGEARAYPQLALVWHEIVNDVVVGEPVSVTYCPLTGSVVALSGSAGGRPLTFGTTGNLVNSNLLMYDRVTDSEWPQLLARAIDGPEKGARLAEAPLVWSRWRDWRAAHPDTRVLSTDTGYSRAYGSDPYGSYSPPGGYYGGGGPIFPVLEESDRFGPKEVVVGVKAGEARVAIRKDRIQAAGALPLEAGRTPLLALWDERLATARIFVRRVRGRTLRFREGGRRDSTGSLWDPSGRAVAGPLAGGRLRPADFLDVMWFAWYAFFPETEVVA